METNESIALNEIREALEEIGNILKVINENMVNLYVRLEAKNNEK